MDYSWFGVYNGWYIVVVFGVAFLLSFVIGAVFSHYSGGPLAAMLALVLGFGLSLVLNLTFVGSVMSANNDTIIEQVTARYGEFTPVDEGERLKPEKEYQIRLNAKPNEFCLLNTASTPQDLTVKCGILTTPTQQE